MQMKTSCFLIYSFYRLNFIHYLINKIIITYYEGIKTFSGMCDTKSLVRSR